MSESLGPDVGTLTKTAEMATQRKRLEPWVPKSRIEMLRTIDAPARAPAV